MHAQNYAKIARHNLNLIGRISQMQILCRRIFFFFFLNERQLYGYQITDQRRFWS